GNGKISGLYNEYNVLKNSAATSIQNTKTTGATVATIKINEAKGTHIKSVNDKKTALLNSMDAEFAGVYAFGIAELNEVGNQALKYANDDLTPFVNGKGSEALGELPTELTNVTNNAKLELQVA